MHKVVYAVKKLSLLPFDLDSTFFDTYGRQEGEGFNFHYQSYEYHPLVCYDDMIDDLLKIELRNGTDYSSIGVVEFLQSLLDEFQEDYLEIPLLLRGDSGFAMLFIYSQCETNGTSYVIRLKQNQSLGRLVTDIEEYLLERPG